MLTISRIKLIIKTVITINILSTSILIRIIAKVDDIYKINKELEAYNPEIAARPQVIAANKIDCIYTEDGEESPIDKLKAEFEPKGIQVYPISAVSGQGVRELLFHVKELLDSCPQEPVVFEQDFFPEDMLIGENLPYTVEQSPEDPTIFVVEGPKIEKMLGYTNLDSEKGFAFFQKFLKEIDDRNLKIETAIEKELKDKVDYKSKNAFRYYEKHPDARIVDFEEI